MRKAVRAIIIHDDRLLVLHRNKFGQEYDTLPGGNVEIGETPEAALRREVAQETSIDFTNPRLVFIEEAGNPYGTQYVYLCDYVSGEPILQEGCEEHLIHQMGRNLYEPGWIPVGDLSDRPFVSDRLKHAILAAVDQSFPANPIILR